MVHNTQRNQVPFAQNRSRTRVLLDTTLSCPVPEGLLQRPVSPVKESSRQEPKSPCQAGHLLGQRASGPHFLLIQLLL